jgi:ABC-2 type transport system permease protein
MTAPHDRAAHAAHAPRPALHRDARGARARPFYWSVRRELWENRSVYLAPLGVAAFVAVGLAIHGATMPSHLPGMLGTEPTRPEAASALYRGMALLMLGAAFLVAAFYCMDALSGERRDRSILFWKSLPVSDRTTVLAKAIVPLVILPAVTLAAIVATQLLWMLISTAFLLMEGHGVALLWREMRLFRMWLALPWTVVAVALWHAPIYAFLLLVSGWARRTAALWAVLPVFALALLEKLTMDTSHVASLVSYRLFGWYGEAFAVTPRQRVWYDALAPLAPGKFLSTPGLWMGLAFAAVCLAAAVRLRRQREPV